MPGILYICMYINQFKYMDFKSLNKEQIQSVTFSGRHLLVLAGAGTGKTTTIVSRVAWLLEQGVQPSRIKIISFTKKSASDIALRAQTSLSSGLSCHVQGSTFHGWCLEIIRSFPDVFSMQNWSVIDTDDQESAFRQIMDEPEFKCLSGVKVSGLASLCSYVVNTGVSLSDAILKSEECSGLSPELLESVISRYSSYKSDNHYLDYDDLISIVTDRLKTDVSFRNKLTSRYDHILVDEMQDTNHLQWELLEIFAPYCSLFCVGDDAQSIYGFRGADFNSIHSFTGRIPESQVIRLVRNYRSTQPLLDVSNALLQHSPLRYDKSLVSVHKKGARPQLVFVRNPKEEACFAVSQISRNVLKGGSYSDNMVLVRSSYQAKHVEAAFISNGIPYRLFGGTSIVRSSHVRDVIAAARLIVNPDDELAWIRYLSLWKGFGKSRSRNILSRLPAGVGIVDKVCSISGTSRLGEAARILTDVAAFRNDAHASIRTLADAMGDVLSLRYPSDWNHRKMDIDMLVTSVAPTLTLDDFISTYLVDTVTDSSMSGDFVTISTIHSAKGLEADNVFVLDITAGNYPSMQAVRNGYEQIEEERRCLYVALTRARRSLFLMTDYATWSMTETLRTDPGQLHCGARFVSNRPDEKAAPSVFTNARIVSLESDYVCFRTDDGRTGYSLINDFLFAYRPAGDRNPPLTVPHFLFGDMDLRLFDSIAMPSESSADRTADKPVAGFSFF